LEENNHHKTIVVTYPDIISWVENKVYAKQMSAVVHEKYLESRHR
jgi:hypothetical protein